jgi:transcriptional regulator with XRE-family HTH domain
MKKHERRKIDRYVGNQLRAARQFRGVSQQELARQIDLTFQQVQKYERGTNRIAASLLYDLSQILKVPVAYFYDGLPPLPTKIEKTEGGEK